MGKGYENSDSEKSIHKCLQTQEKRFKIINNQKNSDLKCNITPIRLANVLKTIAQYLAENMEKKVFSHSATRKIFWELFGNTYLQPSNSISANLSHRNTSIWKLRTYSKLHPCLKHQRIGNNILIKCYLYTTLFTRFSLRWGWIWCSGKQKLRTNPKRMAQEINSHLCLYVKL